MQYCCVFDSQDLRQGSERAVLYVHAVPHTNVRCIVALLLCTDSIAYWHSEAGTAAQFRWRYTERVFAEPGGNEISSRKQICLAFACPTTTEL